MRILSLTLKNYRSLENIEITAIPQLCTIVGANGTGKSTLFDVFRFLSDSLTTNIRHALQLRGGFTEVITRNKPHADLEISLQAQVTLFGTDRPITYHLTIGQPQHHPIVKQETLHYTPTPHSQPLYFINFHHGTGQIIINEEDFLENGTEPQYETQILESSDILAIKGLGQFQRFKAASAFRSLIENWHVSDFHISDARGSKDALYAEHISPVGDNLAIVAQYLYQEHPDIFEQVLERMKTRVPGISDVKATDTEDGRLILKFQDEAFKDPFIDRYVSDGTLKMFAYLILLFDPKPHPLLCVEEPENQLYPTLLHALAAEFASYADRGGQVFVSTHSPDFLNAVPLESIFWLTKTQGVTQIHRASDRPTLINLTQAGDLPGYLWSQGWFEGVAP